MNTQTFRSVVLFLSSVLCPLSSVLAQGSLTPPGTPGATMKSLDQIASTGIAINTTNTPGNGTYEFIINQRGSYYLTGNLGVTKTNGILISSDGVTVDLNGFQISRSSGSAGDAITIQTNDDRCTIKNGSISGFAFGIDCISTGGLSPHTAYAGHLSRLGVGSCTTAASVGGWEIDHCTFHDNVSGLIVSTWSAAVSNCVFNHNSGTALEVDLPSVISNCSAMFNTGLVVFSFGDGSTATNCSVSSNLPTDQAISAGNGCTLIDCSAYNNQSGNRAISAESSCTLTNCNASGNSTTTAGISVDANCTLNGCTASQNVAAAGIMTGDNCTISHCTASANNSSVASSFGLQTGSNCTLTDCTASANNNANGSLSNTTGVGISVTNNCTLTNCTAALNKGDGIELGARCQLAGCTANGNGNGTNGSGISGGIRTVVKNCAAFDNMKNGIVVSANSVVLENHASHNAQGGASTAAGIDTSSGNDSRIEANRTQNNGIGIGIHATTNDIIIRNWSNGNATQYNPATGTNFGPIESPSTSTHPTANF